MHLQARENILNLVLKMKLNEDTDEAYFLCPFSDQDTSEWVDDSIEFPSELVLYFVNLAEEMVYIKDEYLHLFDSDFKEDNEDYENLMDAYISKLPEDREFTCITIEHPDGVMGDFVMFVYEGRIKEEFIKVWS